MKQVKRRPRFEPCYLGLGEGVVELQGVLTAVNVFDNAGYGYVLRQLVEVDEADAVIFLNEVVVSRGPGRSEGAIPAS